MLKISHLLPQMAEQMQHLSVIRRSLTSKEGDHERGTYYVQTAYRPDPTTKHPAMGAILNNELPIRRSRSRTMWPWLRRWVHSSARRVPGRPVRCLPRIRSGPNLNNMRQRVERDRQDRRLSNLDVVSDSFRKGARLGSMARCIRERSSGP